MPRTRIASKKQQIQVDDEIIERKKLLHEYLIEYKKQVKVEISSFDTQAENIYNKIQTFWKVRAIQLTKRFKEMKFNDFLEMKEKENESPEIPLTKTKRNTPLTIKTKLGKLSAKKGSGIGTVKRKKPSGVFTPKFNPKKPITPAMGLRSIKPGEQYVMMSLSGSPLYKDEKQVGQSVLDADGKMILVTTDMSIPIDLDEDIKNKITSIQIQLAKQAEN